MQLGFDALPAPFAVASGQETRVPVVIAAARSEPILEGKDAVHNSRHLALDGTVSQSEMGGEFVNLAWRQKRGGGGGGSAIRARTLSRSEALNLATPIRSTAARNLPTLSVEASSRRAPGQSLRSSAQSSLPVASAARRSSSVASGGGGSGRSGNSASNHPTTSSRRLAAPPTKSNQETQEIKKESVESNQETKGREKEDVHGSGEAAAAAALLLLDMESEVKRSDGDGHVGDLSRGAFVSERGEVRSGGKGGARDAWTLSLSLSRSLALFLGGAREETTPARRARARRLEEEDEVRRDGPGPARLVNLGPSPTEPFIGLLERIVCSML